MELSLSLPPKWIGMPIDLSLKVDRVENISKEDFQNKYMKAQKPLLESNRFAKSLYWDNYEKLHLQDLQNLP